MDVSSKSAPWDSAWNRIGSTDGALTREQQSSGMFAYTQMPVKFEHPSKCRNALGLVGGAEVSNISGNIVDLESDLLGITRTQSKCVGRQYAPACPLGAGACPDTPAPFSFKERGSGARRVVDTAPRHLPACQMTTLPGMPAPKPLATERAYPLRF